MRDELLGHASKDADFLVPGVDIEGLRAALEPHGRTEELVVAGRSVGVRFYPRDKGVRRKARTGIELAPPRRSADQTPPVDRVPDYLRRALKLRPAAYDFFFGLAPGYRRLYVRWIDSAKRPETKRRRLQQALDRLSARHKPTL